MSASRSDPWRLPALDRLGEHIRVAETAELAATPGDEVPLTPDWMCRHIASPVEQRETTLRPAGSG